MSMSSSELTIDGQHGTGASPMWVPEEQGLRWVEIPAKRPTTCAFGGVILDTPFVTSIRPGGVDLQDQPPAGGVFALHPGVRGLPEPEFQQ